MLPRGVVATGAYDQPLRIRSAIQRRCSVSATPRADRRAAARTAPASARRRRAPRARPRSRPLRACAGCRRRGRGWTTSRRRRARTTASRSAARSPGRLRALIAVVHRSRERLAQSVDEEAGAEHQLEDPEQLDRPGRPFGAGDLRRAEPPVVDHQDDAAPGGIGRRNRQGDGGAARLVAERDVDAPASRFRSDSRSSGEARSISTDRDPRPVDRRIAPADPFGLGLGAVAGERDRDPRTRMGSRVSPQPGGVTIRTSAIAWSATISTRGPLAARRPRALNGGRGRAPDARRSRRG